MCYRILRNNYCINTKENPLQFSLFNIYVIDQGITLHQILEKCYEYQINLYQLYIDFRQSYGTIYMTKVFQALQEFVIPGKLIRSTLKNTDDAVKVEGRLSKKFKIKRDKMDSGQHSGFSLHSNVLKTLRRATKVRVYKTI